MAKKNSDKAKNNSENNRELITALDRIEKEKGVPKDLVLEVLETSLKAAVDKNYNVGNNVKVTVDRETGKVGAYILKTVVEEVEDEKVEISLEKAREVKPAYEIGDIFEFEVTPDEFGRIAAQTAKQIVLQKIREAEREVLFNKYKDYENEIFNAVVQRRDRRNIIVTINDIEAQLTQNEQIPGEKFERNEIIPVYVTKIEQTTKGPIITVSRAHPELVRRLFEQNVDEIYDGTVDIKAISREAGSRTKIAVHSNSSDVDAIGACIGPNGIRVNSIVNSLKGEKIDIINWYEDPNLFIAEALSPSEVVAVETNIEVKNDVEEKTAKVVVADGQLSLAIGKNGQNARLAVRLTGWKIDIKSETQSDEINFVSESSYYFREKGIPEELQEIIETNDEDDLENQEQNNIETTVEEVEVNEQLEEAKESEQSVDIHVFEESAEN